MNVYELLKQDEGLMAKMRRCPTGHWTIGFGHNLETTPITERAAMVILEDDVQAVTLRCALFIPSWDELGQVRQAVLVSVAFNVGVTGLQGFRRMLLAIHMRQWERAADELLDSDAGRLLPVRYKRLAEMLKSGEWR